LIAESSAPTPGSPQLLYTPNDQTATRKLLITMKEEADVNDLRSTIHKSIQHLRAHNLKTASLALDDFAIKGLSNNSLVDHITRTAILSGYEFTKYKQPKNPLFEHLEIVQTDKDTELQKTVDEASTIANGTLFARDLGNEQADVANPDYLEEAAKNLCKENPAFSLRVIKGKELEDLGLNMITAVGQAARWSPRLLLLEYKPLAEQNDMPIVLLGKGITFDTGGLNLKPTSFIETMHMDMCGSAAVLGTAKAVSDLKMQQNIGTSSIHSFWQLAFKFPKQCHGFIIVGIRFFNIEFLLFSFCFICC